MMKNKDNTEFEARFLEVDVEDLKKRLKILGAKDLGEEILKEILFYDQDLKWKGSGKRIRIRESKGKVLLAFKHHLKKFH